MTNLTLEERERFWYCTGWPLQATPDDVGKALDCEAWENVAGNYSLYTPDALDTALDEGQSDKIRADACESALRSLAACAVSEELAAVITKWLAAPDLHDFDRLLDGLA